MKTEKLETITVITRDPAAVENSYLGFGAKIVERGKTKFGDIALIVECPTEHTQWNVLRLGSGMHGARVVDDMAEWAKEWGYVADDAN